MKKPAEKRVFFFWASAAKNKKPAEAGFLQISQDLRS
jgi:hypothetical protein